MSMKSLLQHLSDITHIHHRAAFADVDARIAGKPNEFLKLAASRYSCRGFSRQTVTDAQIDLILEAARLAPTAVNKQPVHIWVVKDATLREQLKQATKYTFDAPVIFIVACKEADAWVRAVDGKNGAQTDAAIVGTHLMLQVADLGLGTTWVGSFDPVVLGQLIPEMPAKGYYPMALFPVGYPDAGPSPRHDSRKPLEELVTVL